MKVVKTNCPSCGASVDVSEDKPKTKCKYCGSDVLLISEKEKSTSSYINLGKQCLETYDNEKAKEYFNKALEKNPSNSLVWFWLGVTELFRISTTTYNTEEIGHRSMIKKALSCFKKAGYSHSELAELFSQNLQDLDYKSFLGGLLESISDWHGLVPYYVYGSELDNWFFIFSLAYEACWKIDPEFGKDIRKNPSHNLSGAFNIYAGNHPAHPFNIKINKVCSEIEQKYTH